MTIMTSSFFRTTSSPIFTPPPRSWSPPSKPAQKPPDPSGGSCFHYASEVSNEPKSENGVGSHRADLQLRCPCNFPKSRGQTFVFLVFFSWDSCWFWFGCCFGCFFNKHLEDVYIYIYNIYEGCSKFFHVENAIFAPKKLPSPNFSGPHIYL